MNTIKTLIFFLLIGLQHFAAFSQDSIKPTDSLIYGKATYYGRKFQGRKTASGQKFSNKSFTAAHANLPFNTKIKVTNTLNNKQVEVIINDRCRRKNKNIVDLSYVAAKEIDMLGHGVVPITYQVIYPTDSLLKQDSIPNLMQSEQ
ncbi:MAG: septal ring lytic transglycosylase RlpA family protein [Bacteroidota bacterium]